MACDTGDLRSQAKDAQRTRNHNHKWARGGRPAPGKKTCSFPCFPPTCGDSWDRPATQTSTSHLWGPPFRSKNHISSKSHISYKKMARRDVTSFSGSSESSAAEDEVEEPSTTVEPDAEIMYSYDATHGPNGGSQVLGFAVNQAVERFENKQTEQLAKEYEFVDGKDGYVADADDDDFEIVDDSSFR